MPEMELRSYLVDQSHSHCMRVHFVLQQEGGGSKVDAHHRIKQQALDFLLQCGADALHVKQFVHDLYERAGSARLQHTLQIKDSDEKQAQLIRLAKALQLTPIAFEDLEAERNKKVRSWKPKAVQPTTQVRAEDFAVVDGAFTHADGSPAKVCVLTDATKEGVMLIDQGDVDDFLDTLTVQPKALAICVRAHSCTLNKSKCCPIQVPALDQSKTKVVLKGCLHQVGTSPVCLSATNESNVPVEASRLVAITVWKSEVAPEMWDQLTSSPAKIAAQILSIKPSEHYATAPWGRVFRDHEKVCEAEHAASFQCHARIRNSVLNLILARSGMEGAYVTPKSETLNRADEQYTVVWHPDATWPQVPDRYNSQAFGPSSFDR